MNGQPHFRPVSIDIHSFSGQRSPKRGFHARQGTSSPAVPLDVVLHLGRLLRSTTSSIMLALRLFRPHRQILYCTRRTRRSTRSPSILKKNSFSHPSSFCYFSSSSQQLQLQPGSNQYFAQATHDAPEPGPTLVRASISNNGDTEMLLATSLLTILQTWGIAVMLPCYHRTRLSKIRRGYVQSFTT